MVNVWSVKASLDELKCLINGECADEFSRESSYIISLQRRSYSSVSCRMPFLRWKHQDLFWIFIAWYWYVTWKYSFFQYLGVAYKHCSIKYSYLNTITFNKKSNLFLYFLSENVREHLRGILFLYLFSLHYCHYSLLLL